ncbi:MICOS complex subunit Mic60 [Eumeta japonica]|uniref:MICOS complex subunit Mic60 n=1 Tax=Eumeta variegata TaxID=151549 RepID=A0A4C1SEZ1_EUMVA|nr:MICOS complex subunit Mic60 [Eumeta japonica]
MKLKIPIATSKSVEAKPENKVETPKPKAKPIEPLPSNVVELEHAVDAAALAVKEYNKAIEILKKLNKTKVSQDDLDLFITHARSHVLALQKELERLQTDGELRLKHAIDALRGDSDSDAVKQLEYRLEERKLAIENQRKYTNSC